MPESATAERILVVDPVATATHVAVFDGEGLVVAETLTHRPEELAACDRIWDQFLMRKDRVAAFLACHDLPLDSLSAVVGCGGLLKPVPAGTYRIGAAMLEDLRHATAGEDAANLGAILAYAVAHALGIDAFVVDPPAVGELDPVARIGGLPEMPRTCLTHALGMRAAGRRAADAVGKRHEEARLVVAHLGLAISVAALRGGRMTDGNRRAESGPFSPEGAGTLPAGDLVKLSFSGKHTQRELLRRLTTMGGLVAHLGTRDRIEVERRIALGDPVAQVVYNALAYQVAREIGAMAVALQGDIDAVVLTGPLAHSALLVSWIQERIAWVGPVMVYPGDDDLRDLAAGSLRVLRGEEEALVYA
ncbi:MAG: butyrate kinase [Mycobacterium leprae]